MKNEQGFGAGLFWGGSVNMILEFLKLNYVLTHVPVIFYVYFRKETSNDGKFHAIFVNY